MKRDEAIKLAKSLLEQAKAEELSKALPASAPAGSGGQGPKMTAILNVPLSEKPKKKKPLVAFATTIPKMAAPMSAARSMFKSDCLHEKVMAKREISKAENPDAKADAQLGEKVEHLVEDHVKDNLPAERKEGHRALITEDLKKEFTPRFYKCMDKAEPKTHEEKKNHPDYEGHMIAGQVIYKPKAKKTPKADKPADAKKAEKDPSQAPVFVRKPIKEKEPVDNNAPVMRPPVPVKGKN